MRLSLDSPSVDRHRTLFDRFLGNRIRHAPPDHPTTNAPEAAQAHDQTPDADGPDEMTPCARRLYLEARQHIKRHAWGHAQHALEGVARRDPDGTATLDLKSIRAIRRALRRTSRWPSDVEAHLDLGRACFDLDLGDDALTAFDVVQRLAPRRYEGFALAALEYLYRGEYTHAMTVWLRARALNPELPELDEVMGSLPTR